MLQLGGGCKKGLKLTSLLTAREDGVLVAKEGLGCFPRRAHPSAASPHARPSPNKTKCTVKPRTNNGSTVSVRFGHNLITLCRLFLESDFRDTCEVVRSLTSTAFRMYAGLPRRRHRPCGVRRAVQSKPHSSLPHLELRAHASGKLCMTKPCVGAARFIDALLGVPFENPARQPAKPPGGGRA